MQGRKRFKETSAVDYTQERTFLYATVLPLLVAKSEPHLGGTCWVCQHPHPGRSWVDQCFKEGRLSSQLNALAYKPAQSSRVKLPSFRVHLLAQGSRYPLRRNNLYSGARPACKTVKVVAYGIRESVIGDSVVLSPDSMAEDRANGASDVRRPVSMVPRCWKGWAAAGVTDPNRTRP